jgi:nitrate reductase molybdenum cofactor assembly chaperone NarJ/NarW
MSECLDHERALPKAVRAPLYDLIEEFATGDLYDLQERYVLLFDRTRSLSLHLFEHVHGESRDRGQAMIDLKGLYEKNGLAMSAAELPDFLPLFLEFLSTRSRAEACSLLAQPAHVLAALAERLKQRGSSYEAVFRALVVLAGTRPAEVEASMLAGAPDFEPNDFAALDAEWEDAPVSFGPGASNCKDEIVARVRAGRRPAPGLQLPASSGPRTIITTSPARRS